MNYWNSELHDVLKALNSSLEGLSSSESSERLKANGLNAIKEVDEKGFFHILFSQFSNPLIIVLFVVVIVSFFTKESANAVVILLMLTINTVLGFVQEYRAYKSLSKLRKLIVIKSKVLRDGKVTSLDSKNIVVGDIVILNRGDIVPADIRLFETKHLTIDESTLTGESIDVEKQTVSVELDKANPQDIVNCAFQGTAVTSGFGKGVVFAVSGDTFLGRSVHLGKEEQKTNFARNMESFTKVLFAFVLIITTLSMLTNIFFGRGILESLIIGILLALGITPETMPILVSISLSLAASKLSKKHVLVKRLTSFEDLGNVDILCSDKTGTLTTGELIAEYFLDETFKENDTVILHSLICNAFNPATESRIFQNAIDESIWNTKKAGLFKSDLEKFKISNIWDFDFETRIMGVLFSNGSESRIIAKGAFEQISKMCTATHSLAKLEEELSQWENRGYRVIAVASKISNDNDKNAPLSKMKDFKLEGFVLLLDPPRETVMSQVKKLQNLNIQLKVITGDSLSITKEICKKVNLAVSEEEVISGEDLAKLEESDFEKYSETVLKTIVFARVSPEQKQHIIEFLREKGHVVAYIGDGINDVGALRAADVGIAVDSATDVAKDSSDLILLSRNLDALINAIIEGRRVFVNTMKFIFSTMSSSFGNVITITFASFFLPFLPLLPAQLLILDFLSDFQHLAISTDNVDDSLLKKPRNWNMKVFVKYSIIWGIMSTLFDIFHIVVILAISSSPELFRTAWVFESITTEIIATMSLRTHLSILKGKPSRMLVIFSAIPVIIFLAISYTDIFDKWFDLTPMSFTVLGIVSLIILLYVAGLELIKKSYFRNFWGVGK